MLEFIRKFLGTNNEAEIKRLKKTVDKINALEPKMKALTDDGIRDYVKDLKQKAQFLLPWSLVRFDIVLL